MKLIDIAPYSTISKFMGMNEKMLYRYDNQGSISESNRIKLNEFIHKFKTDDNFKKLIQNASVTEPPITIVYGLIGSVIDALGILITEQNELYKITLDLANYVENNSPVSIEDFAYRLETQASTIRNLSEQIEFLSNKVNHEKERNAINTIPPDLKQYPITPDQAFNSKEIYNAPIIESSEIDDDKFELLD
jgi:hypothetical protein